MKPLALARVTLGHLFRRKWRIREIIRAIEHIGIESIPLVVVCTSVAGVVLSQEIAWHLDRSLHTVEMLPGFAGQFILRELAITIPAFVLISRAGASLTAEIGTMAITEQLDALRLLKIDPTEYLVAPRWIAFVISSVSLTLFACAVTLSCAVAAGVLTLNFNTLEYLNAVRNLVKLDDLVCALTKGAAFGAVIPIICASFGFRCKGGAQGVGEATTQSVVTSTVVVIVLDFLLTWAFSA